LLLTKRRKTNYKYDWIKCGLLQVAADDSDEGENGAVAYTSVLGDDNCLQVDSKSGWITVRTNKHIFDRESAKGKHQRPDFIIGFCVRSSSYLRLYA
jgi:hypothetical protein